MSDDEKKNKKPIDVTKPRNTPSSNFDTSKVSDYTLREQQALEKLKKSVGNYEQKESHSSIIKTIVAVILVLMLIGIAIAFVMIIGKEDTPESDYDMRLSMQIENKSSLSIITETGQEQLREINPGDEIPIRASVRNSTDITGDKTEEGAAPPAIYVRFRLVLILDYEARYDIMVPTMTDRWYKFNQDTENSLVGGVSEDDHYFYYLGSLTYMEPEVLFSSILFDGNAITCDDGGKYGQIQVHVESIEADINNILGRTLWPTAPQGWIQEMIAMWNGLR